jgi:predicted Zn-ribbon and HTH transcriptional regulator
MKSKGIGDTIEKITKATGIKKIVEVVSKASGRDCGCNARKEKLNNPNLLVNKILYKK